MIHENPDNGVLWQQLGKHIISSSPEKSSIAGKCAKTASIMSVVTSPVIKKIYYFSEIVDT